MCAWYTYDRVSLHILHANIMCVHVIQVLIMFLPFKMHCMYCAMLSVFDCQDSKRRNHNTASTESYLQVWCVLAIMAVWPCLVPNATMHAECPTLGDVASLLCAEIVPAQHHRNSFVAVSPESAWQVVWRYRDLLDYHTCQDTLFLIVVPTVWVTVHVLMLFQHLSCHFKRQNSKLACRCSSVACMVYSLFSV